jgi:hypothetical protein
MEKTTQATIEKITPKGSATFITLKAGNMRKSESFIVYPIKADDDAKRISIQSDHRCAIIDTQTGNGLLTAYVANYPSFAHLSAGKTFRFTVSEADLSAIRMSIFTSADAKADMGGGVMFTDNSGAKNIL